MKKNKIPKMNLTKEVKDLYTDERKLKTTQTDGKIYLSS